ncbi:MAG: hypothetical protein ISS66_17975 [Desulfobacteraceae bacterium]|nr:hypothetical protein [Desulfobacteraceae bacterium]
MKRLIFGFLTIFTLSFLAVPAYVFTQNCLQLFENGKVDWSHSVAEAIGIGHPPVNPINKAQARAKAKSEAITAARRNLIEIIKKVQIDSKNLIENCIGRSDKLFKEIQDHLQSSQVVDISYKPDGSVKATVSILLTGSFADLVLPKAIRNIKPIKQEKPADKEGKAVFTGLVVDCRGFQLKPALAPKIVDEDGREVYGSVYVSRHYAVKQGLAGYTKDLLAAQKNLRVANRPLIVKGIGTSRTGKTDIVISNADAAKIRSAASNLSLLQKCKVVIVAD